MKPDRLTAQRAFAEEYPSVLVLGLGLSGLAAAELLHRKGVRVTAVDQANTSSLQRAVEPLRAGGVRVELGAKARPDGAFNLAVVSPGVPGENPIRRAVALSGIPEIGELELGYRFTQCPNISITGTNGKTTTTELVAGMLQQAQLKTIAAGNIGLPLCQVVEQTDQLDYVTLEVSSFQLETIQQFRPSVAVLLNLTPDHFDRYACLDDYLRAKARLFLNQQASDWVIIQSAAWRQLQNLGIKLPSRVMTFSANEPEADLYLEGEVVASRVPDRCGPLYRLSQGLLRGPHNAENLMATLAVGLVLQLPQASVVSALSTYAPAPHRCEWVAEIGGVTFINDSKATNVDAVRQALLLTVPDGPENRPNVWLIAGGKDKGFAYDDLEIGPLLAKRVKRAILIGEARKKILAAWRCFAPCTESDSLLEAVSEAAGQAVSGDVILLSPACSSFDMFQNYQHRGEVFREAVAAWARQRQPAPSGDRDRVVAVKRI
jgi:UDP-N-acetylmuramoylalanine--D-glutamate ligase